MNEHPPAAGSVPLAVDGGGALGWLLQRFNRGVARLPLPRALAFGRGMGWVYGSLLRYHRRDALDALARSLPDRDESARRTILHEMYRQLGMNMVEILRLDGGRTDELDARIGIEGEEIVQEALKRGRGVLTAHLGNWDLLGMFTGRRGYPLTIISKTIRPAGVNAMWMRMRRAFGVSIVPAHNSYRELLRVLKRNELLGFILDQNRPAEQGIFVDFFGRPASTSPGLAFLAAQSRAPVVPVFIHREGLDRHVLRVLPVLEPPPDRSEENIRAATQAYTTVIENEIRRHPEQWIWLHRRWKSQPKETKTEPADDADERG
jgi:KDO2-lipid IV(A) lauroyltransferase